MSKIKFVTVPTLRGIAHAIFNGRDIATIGKVTNIQSESINETIYPALKDFEERIEELESKVKKLEKNNRK